MAVYTALSKQDIEQLLKQYDIGDLSDFQEISSGIENTNYFVTTILQVGISKRWVLTLFENLEQADLPYFCDLTGHLQQDGFKVPAPLKNRSGECVFSLKDKAGVLVPCLLGASLENPDAKACSLIAAYLAGMHLSLRTFSQHRTVERNTQWMQQQLDRLESKMSPIEFKLLDGYFRRYQAYQSHLQECPQGTVHGDLFKDNVLFDSQGVSGIFDFYHACDATLLFDLAVLANDWALGEQGKYDKEKLVSLCDGYQSQRPWTNKEKQMWPFCLELAALRFWISRLVSKHLPSYQQQSLSGETIKDPDEMKVILQALACSEEVMPSLF